MLSKLPHRTMPHVENTQRKPNHKKYPRKTITYKDIKQIINSIDTSKIQHCTHDEEYQREFQQQTICYTANTTRSK